VPHLKLLPDVAIALGHTVAELPQLHSQTVKHIHCVKDSFPETPLPMKRMYVLAAGPHNVIQLLQPQEAFVELVRHSRAVGLLRSPHFVIAHFYQCAELVKRVPICRLIRPLSFTAISETVRLIETDLTCKSAGC
jgi:hypothetical protein